MVLKFLAVFIVGEMLAIVIFAEIWRRLGPSDEQGHGKGGEPAATRRLEVVKGALERFVVTTGLLMNFQGVLTLYAALKLANRLRHEESKDEMSDDESNRITNYFLIGNLLSILLCLLYVGAVNMWDGYW